MTALRTAMLLAAGRGERLRPLTEHTPKPLIEVGGRSLIEHQLARLQRAGIRRVVVNLHHLGEQIRARLGDGSAWDLEILYSPEPRLLDTAGGIRAALPLLGPRPFLVISADVWTDADLTALCAPLPADVDVHLLLVPTPSWRDAGDFDLRDDPPGPARLQHPSAGELVYAGLGVMRPEAFADLTPGPRPLRPVLDRAIDVGRATGARLEGPWEDVGTPERLAALRARLGDTVS